jgi:hypothetical protein
MNLPKFLTVKKGQYILEKIDEYRQGQSFQVFYRGVEIFNQELNIFGLKETKIDKKNLFKIMHESC